MVQNPKPEGRNPKEGRSPKAEGNPEVELQGASGFGFRISFGFRVQVAKPERYWNFCDPFPLTPAPVPLK
jgi:hypothetical protein